MYGIAVSALGILSTLCTGLTIDAYGPICDNAGGIAEMSGMAKQVRERTDALDAAGNTTAAIGKGFGTSIVTPPLHNSNTTVPL
jgi:inorganic pyrophosphatase